MPVARQRLLWLQGRTPMSGVCGPKCSSSKTSRVSPAEPEGQQPEMLLGFFFSRLGFHKQSRTFRVQMLATGTSRIAKVRFFVLWLAVLLWLYTTSSICCNDCSGRSSPWLPLLSLFSLLFCSLHPTVLLHMMPATHRALLLAWSL